MLCLISSCTRKLLLSVAASVMAQSCNYCCSRHDAVASNELVYLENSGIVNFDDVLDECLISHSVS